MALSLLGIPADDPKARIAREFRYAQGESGTGSPGRAIVLVANKTAAGSEPVETLGEPIQDINDCFVRFGRRSEIAHQYRALRMVAPRATVYAVAVAENGTAAASTVTFTFATAATGSSTLRIDWGGRRLEVGIASGDSANAQAAAFNAKVNADPDLPFSGSVSNGVATITTANLGPRSAQLLNALRVYYAVNVGTTVSKGSVTAGTGADDYTNALAALGTTSIYYHAPACTAVSGVTATDGGVGQYCQFIRDQAAPAVGKDQQVIFGLDCTQSQGTAVATSSAANLVRAGFYRVQANDWTSAMVAAHMAGVRWLKEQAYPAASLTGYANGDGTPFAIPDPYDKTKRPSSTEVTADLNNGVTPICFTPLGGPNLDRGITSYSVLPGTANKDYRARESHIPSAEDAAWEYLYQRWSTTRQPNIAGDPRPGARPMKGFNTPGGMKRLVNSAIDVLTSSASPFDNMPILDPDPAAVQRMRDSVYVEQRADGIGVSVNWEPVRHDNKDDFLILQGGPAY
jgi:phage tail sheath gpL-like